MRNGIYRVWYRNTENRGVAAVILSDGQFVACDRTHYFLGSYSDTNGRFEAEVEVSCHTRQWKRPEFPDADVFHMILRGTTTGETINAICRYREEPGRTLDCEYVWCGAI